MDDVVRIPTSRGLDILVSPEDAHLSAYRWTAFEASSGRYYGIRCECSGGCQRTVYIHRQIIGAAPGQLVDHINGDGMDNRRCNLRLATHSLNTVNRKSKGSASGFRGVFPDRGRWRVMLWSERKKVEGGKFDSPEEAARQYDALAKIHHGDFAVLNFPGAA